LEYTDLILFDVKNLDSEKHKEKCGVDNQLILENLEKAAKKTKVWLRVPLIPGYNDSESDMRLVAELAKRINAEKISLLPYHEYGKQKYPRVGKEYEFDEAEILAAEDEIVIRNKEILESYDLNVGISG
jgi:pyruvate formate lyase activating enzyme